MGYRRILPFYREHLAGHPRLKLRMLHFFVNTGIRDTAYYWNELRKALDVYCTLRKECPELTALNNLYAAAYALRSRGLDSATGETETRADVWLRQFNEQLADLVSSDLTGVGVTLATTTGGRRPRLRSTQLRRVDGYSAVAEGDEYPYDYPAE